MAKKHKKEKRYIITQKRVDEFTVVRKRVELTRDRCNICGLSICELNGLPPFDDLSEELRARVVGTLDSHKMKAHTTADKKILPESELPTQWLSNELGRKEGSTMPAQHAVDKRLATEDDV